LAVGLLLGALAYRLLLPVALALAVTGTYLRWQAPLADTTTHPAAATVEAADLKIDLHSSTAPASAPTSQPGAASELLHAAEREWGSLPPSTQHHTALLALATLVAGLVFCLLMFRRATMVMTAMLGSLAIFLGLHGVLQVYARPYAGMVPASPWVRYGILAGMTVVGVLIQWRFFREYVPPARKPEPAPPKETAVKP
jgi:hypothetical protein